MHIQIRFCYLLYKSILKEVLLPIKLRSGVVIRNNSQSGGSSALSPANKLQKFTITTGPALFRDKPSDFERGPTARQVCLYTYLVSSIAYNLYADILYLHEPKNNPPTEYCFLCIFNSVIIPLIPSRQGGDPSPSDPGIYYSSASTPTTEQQRHIAAQVWSNIFLSLEEDSHLFWDHLYDTTKAKKQKVFKNENFIQKRV